MLEFIVHQGVQGMMDDVDTNNDGHIDKSEMIDELQEEGAQAGHYTAADNLFDSIAGADQKVSQNELAHLYQWARRILQHQYGENLDW